MCEVLDSIAQHCKTKEQRMEGREREKQRKVEKQKEKKRKTT